MISTASRSPAFQYSTEVNVFFFSVLQLMEGVKNLTTERKSAAELTEASPVMLHCSNTVSSTSISPSKGLNEGAWLQPTAET